MDLKIRAKKEDRISNLPDDLLHQILSHIQTKHAAQTCILSKRWNRIWATLPHLNANASCFRLPANFIRFVRKFLKNRQICTIRLNLGLLIIPEFIRRYIANYEICHNLRELSLESAHFTGSFRSWSFPVLKTLNLTNCTNVPLMSWNLPALRTLALRDVTFLGDEVFSVMGFVHLRNLTVRGSTNWHGMEVFFITSYKLVNLTISQDYEEPRTCFFVVTAPSLSCLEYSGNSPLLLSAVDGLPSLGKVNIDIGMANERKYYFEKEKHVFIEELISMFEELRGAKFLTLSFGTIEVLSRVLELLDFQPSPFGDLKCLKLEGKPWKFVNPTITLERVINYFLSSSPRATILKQDVEGIFRADNQKENMCCPNRMRSRLRDTVVEPRYASGEVDSSGEEVKLRSDEEQVNAGGDKGRSSGAKGQRSCKTRSRTGS